jgi:hypothetical protein
LLLLLWWSGVEKEFPGKRLFCMAATVPQS